MLFRKGSPADNLAGVLKEFRKVKRGEPLPREGACAYFYTHVTYAGQTIAIEDGRRFRFFHVEHDDIIREIIEGTPSWHVAIEEERTVVSILFTLPGGLMNRMEMALDATNRNSLRILEFLSEAKHVDIHLLALLYGGIVRDATLTIQVPGEVRHSLERIKKPAG
ncbi:MAG: hypothetical protein JW838_03380 [Spirochaetes bacterium]|nr:hypothetical protein [Spirochaetota bacterium]